MSPHNRAETGVCPECKGAGGWASNVCLTDRAAHAAILAPPSTCPDTKYRRKEQQP